LLTILIPKMKVLVFFVIPMRMWMAMVFFLVFFWFLSAYAGLPIGNSAHFGGFVTGLMYGIYLKQKFPNKTEMIKRHFS
jgi:membrane associated rhomboid family serine protease